MADESLKSKQCSSEGFPHTFSLSPSLSLFPSVCVSLCAMKSIEKLAGKVIVAYDMANERQRHKKRNTVINDE